MKKLLSAAWILFISICFLAACGPKRAQDIISKELGLPVPIGREISNFNTHSGNGDGVTCIALRFDDNTFLENIMDDSGWSEFPLDSTVQTLVYGVSDGTSKTGPFLSDTEGNPLVPDIRSGYYLLIDRQGQKGLTTEADILHRGSFNFTLGLYDTDTNTLYFCQLDT